MIVETTGRIIYKNQHNGGAGNTWIDLREQIEPGYREYIKGEKEKFAATDAPPPEPWDEPIPLTGAAILPEFPVKHLPCLVRTFVTSVAESRQTPVDLPGVLALGVVAAGVARKFKVQIGETHSDPTNIYTCVAMNTGERKSPVLTDMAEPLEVYEREMADSMRCGAHPESRAPKDTGA